MSWKLGSHATTSVPCLTAQRRDIPCWLVTRLNSDTSTPFGEPVEPDVYCSSAGCIGSRATGA